MKLASLIALILLVSCVPSEQEQALVFMAGKPNNVESIEESYPLQLRMADRTYVESVLNQAFDISKETPTALLVEQHTLQRFEFGGSCDLYEASEYEKGKIEFPREQCYVGLGSSTPATSNPMRYSWTIKICEQLVKDIIRFNAIMKKIFPDGANLTPTSQSIEKAYGIFFLEEKPDENSLKALLELSNTVEDVNEKWRLIMLTLCISPEWQVL